MADIIQFVPKPNPNRPGLSMDQFDNALCTKLQDYYDDKRAIDYSDPTQAETVAPEPKETA